MLDSVLEAGKKYASEILEPGDIAIDATLGNGHDTVFLSKLNKLKKIYGFDIQETAIESTKNNLSSIATTEVELILDGHENVKNYVQDTVKVAFFNLGYLPSGDKNITTLPETTLSAISSITELLAKRGRIIITVYHGHDNGKIERDALLKYVSELDQKQFNVLQYQFINQKNNAPFLIVIEKK
ncbi:tRNA (mnm(5)s(2)U34)-methyltransferase [Phocicoccus pinnipedialis]|uniref:Ribosomal RNA small subunit methyltransferase H n=1 Tax=Phocicoccus pinnipedialis TaxID=110845 RepID=A0A6V7RBL7_9BACL|nr:class I SAM-dependent methyltransferase [Jeotgalicoccus pinnipedialis]MBP1939563.1 16S rRNA C1402 N4-methylase RsmH [Jeotgalicoccus pinnipedialis]CAD2074945.1 Ribosomal RNA small subunit methyltransferase H [Jeotgalicoccus pinnipedialis]